MSSTTETTVPSVRILIVEDSPTQLAALRFLLEESGFAVVGAPDGREGLEAARANALDLVISDIVMPEMDGYALCRALRADETLRHLPVILLTSLTDPHDVIRGLESGATHLISKPYDDLALLARVQHVLANRDLREAATSETATPIVFAGQQFVIKADRLQILDLLLSTYESAVDHNAELLRTRDELRTLNEQLSDRVAERTAALTIEIEERKRAETQIRLASKVQELLNRTEDSPDAFREILNVIRDGTRFDAAGIRLRAGDDFPYYAAAGFPNEFLLAESSLCARDGSDGLLYDEQRLPVLDCVCGAVISGRTDPGLPFFTEGGSFWTNGTTKLLASTPGNGFAAHLRSRCNREGYESVGLFPLLSGSEIMGLLQLNDPRPDRFTPEIVGFLEGLGISIGVALARKRAEIALASSEEMHRALFASSPDALIVMTPPTWRFTDANRAALRLFGAPSASELTAGGPEDVSPERQPDGRLSAEKAQELIATALRDGSHAFVWELRRFNGETFAADVLLARMEAKGQVFLQVSVRDIRERKEGALQGAIFNSAHFSSIATDERGVIQIFNVGAERMLGYAAADVVNRITPADISDPEELIARARALSLELDTQITPGFEALVFKASRAIEDIYELTYIRKDGSRFPAVVSVTALRDDQGAIIGYLLIGTDNTARKQVEAEQEQLGQRLRDHQFYTRSLFEANIDALMTTDPAGIITDVNKQAEALTGCTRDELIGAPFKSHFTDPDQAEASIKQVLSEKKVTNYELTASAKGGRDTVVSLNATTFYDRDRRLQGVFAAARDVTERKRLDQVLQEKNVELEGARSVAERANLAKSEFLSNMSHELRSPLNAILGFAQLMESASPPPAPAQTESIAQILQAGWHLLTLIDEILDLAKVESGKVPLSREPVSVGEVLLDCQGMFEPQAQQRHVGMTFPPFDPQVFVSADRTRVKQILINLLSNAIKYNIPGGTIDVTCHETVPGRVRVSIRDSGKGLTPEQLPQLFQAFHRLGQEAGAEEGTGIGLVVAKRLVELMGGTIGVESEVGVGSVFWFELDAAPAPSLSAELAGAAQHAQRTVSGTFRLHTLLYVEDNPANLKLVAEIIARRPDIHLLTSGDGLSGVALARASRPDVILMDINLPGMNGFEALSLLRSDPITARIPVIALSANAMPLAVARGAIAGFFRYITKPIKVNEFMETLDLALELVGERPSEGR
jgi:PAS domain S-box-containing protein